MNITCDKDHRYWIEEALLGAFEPTRREVPGVTSILMKAGLINLRWINEYALDRGTAVHAAIHYDNAGDLDEASLDPAVKPYLEQWRRFKKMMRCKVLNGEQIVYSRLLNYAGRYDLLLDYPSAILIDIKTNKKPKHVEAQLGFYAFALREAGVPVHRAGCLELFVDDFKLTTWEPLQAEAEAMRVLAQVKEMPR